MSTSSRRMTRNTTLTVWPCWAHRPWSWPCRPAWASPAWLTCRSSRGPRPAASTLAHQAKAALLTSALVDKLGVPGTHVPFVGEGAGLTALMGQQIHAMTLVIGTAAAQVKAGKLVPLALV